VLQPNRGSRHDQPRNQLIVFGVGADPDPFHDAGFQEAERPVMVSDPHCHQSLGVRRQGMETRQNGESQDFTPRLANP